MRSAVCALLVVAPPISSGVFRPSRCISPATVTISSSDGVISPDRPIMSALLSLAALQNVLPRHHDAEVDDLEAVALQDHADDVLADVVNVALDGRHDDPALALGRAGLFLLRLDEGDEVGDRALHHPRRLHHLRQEHLARPEQVADDVHAVHQRAFDDLDRAPTASANCCRASSVSSTICASMPLTSA